MKVVSKDTARPGAVPGAPRRSPLERSDRHVLARVGHHFRTCARWRRPLPQGRPGDDECEAFLLEVLAEHAVTTPEVGEVRAGTPPLVVLTSTAPARSTTPAGMPSVSMARHLLLDHPDLPSRRRPGDGPAQAAGRGGVAGLGAGDAPARRAGAGPGSALDRAAASLGAVLNDARTTIGCGRSSTPCRSAVLLRQRHLFGRTY